MELREYWLVMRKKLWIVLLLPLLAAAVSTLYVLHKGTWYTVEETLLVNETQNASGTPDTATYVGVLQSQLFAETLNRQASSNYTVRELNQISYQFNGQLITMALDTRNPAYGRKILTAIGETVDSSHLIPNITGGVVIDPPATTPMSKHRIRDVALATGLALLAAIGIAFLQEYLDLRFKSEADIVRYLNISPLGVVSQYKLPRKVKNRSAAKPAAK